MQLLRGPLQNFPVRGQNTGRHSHHGQIRDPNTRTRNGSHHIYDDGTNGTNYYTPYVKSKPLHHYFHRHHSVIHCEAFYSTDAYLAFGKESSVSRLWDTPR